MSLLFRRHSRRADGLRVLLNTPRGVWLGENLGDVAMCQAAVRRFADAAPRAEIAVVVDEPSVLGAEAERIDPIPSPARDHWFRDPAYPGARRFAWALARADVVATTGHGALLDEILHDSASHLRVIDAATRRGAVTALLGHGIGPFTNPDLLALGAEVLPRVDVICVREDAVAPPQLVRLGVDRRRIAVTGDDATEVLACPHPAGRQREAKTSVGLSIRSPGIGPAARAVVADAVRALAARHRLEVEPLPIDPTDVAGLTAVGLPCELPLAIDAVASSARRCRAVVACAYHGCLFALAQGVPAVALAATDFYRAKMGGLARWFPSGCEVVEVCEDDLAGRVAAALERALACRRKQRKALMASTLQQAAAGRAVVAAIVGCAVAERSRRRQ